MKHPLVKWGIVGVLSFLFAGVITGIIILVVRENNSERIYSFPADFKIGAASSCYQIEGGWDEDGKSPSIWDTIIHANPDYVADKSNADVAADSYHMVEKDIQALVNAGVSVKVFVFVQIFHD